MWVVAFADGNVRKLRNGALAVEIFLANLGTGVSMWFEKIRKSPLTSEVE